MQTKHQIQQLLASTGLSPNKRLGQNFLIDLNLMRLLLDTAKPTDSDIVLEIGCGTGSLTQGLSELAGCVIAVEFDKNLADIARQQTCEKENVEIINADILEKKSSVNPIVLEKISSAQKQLQGRLLLIANLPYSVACPAIINLITGPLTVKAMFVTVQKEVADRMTASPGDGHYGIMSILMQIAGSVKLLKILSPSVFWPQPVVDSAMVSFIRCEQKAKRIKNMQLFRDCLGLFMQHRRKQLKGCTKFATGRLAKLDWDHIFAQTGINPCNRPEQLSPEDYLSIANLCSVP